MYLFGVMSRRNRNGTAAVFSNGLNAGASGQVCYADAAGLVTSDANFTWNSGTTTLTIAGGVSATSVKNSSLTSGRVPFAGAAGLMQDSAGLTYSANALTVGDGTASAIVLINGLAGTGRRVDFQTAGSTRWRILANTTAEGGANAGSNLTIQAFDDSGTIIDTPLTINRVAGGGFTFGRPLQPGSGSAAAPSYAFSTDTTTGFYRVSAGSIGVVNSGTERMRYISTGGQLVSLNSATFSSAPITNIQAQTLHGNDATQVTYAVCAYGAAGGFYSRRAEGTASALSACVSGTALLTLFTQGYEGTTPGFTTARSPYQIVATETWTSAAQGFRHDWFGSANGTTTTPLRLRLDQDGNLLIGTSTNGLTAGGSLAISQDLAHRGTNLGLFNTAPTTKKTGYGTPTGGAVTANYPGATATLAQTSGTLAQLLLDLKAYGLIGA